MTGAGRVRLALGAALLALLAGCAGPAARQAGSSPATGSPTAEAGGADAVRGFHSARDYRATPLPTRISIPGIHVAATLDRLGRAADGTIQNPTRWEVPGWYAGGPRPGEPGSAVILGHVDSKRGPAVFYRLRELRRGDEIEVTRADGSSVRFVVERTAQYDKKRFPTDDVYYPTLSPKLRLVTCGGEFDVTAGHYKSNIVVFASLKT
jgi:hypothetical protein